jgi:hypothetical protein
MKVILKRLLLPLSHENQIRFWGIILCYIHLVTFLFWSNKNLEGIICSPLFPDCQSFFAWSSSLRHIYLTSYGLLAMLTAFFFLLKKDLFARLGFVILCLMKLIYHLSDYRNMGNYHYISHLFNLIFLLSPQKLKLSKLFLVLTYAAAGLLKFNTDWLSGAVIRAPFYFSGKSLEWVSAWVIVLELGLVWFLLSKIKWLKWFVLFQLVLFHILSWKIVGFFYPVVMLLLLSVFLLDRDDFDMRYSIFEVIPVGIFIIAQLVPLLFFPLSSLDGKGRIFSLNMFDAMSECRSSAFLRFKHHTVEYNPSFNHYGVRIKCDPWLLVNQLKLTCKGQQKNSSFVDADVSHQVKRFSDSYIPVTFSFKDICTRPLDASFWGVLKQK